MGEEELEGVAVGVEGTGADPFDVREVLIKELM
jgi:hypothetical protein